MTARTQTRGFLFADLRGYSEFTDRHGDAAARELIARYRAIVRAVIDEHDGAEIRTEGDSFYVVFDSVAEAVLAGMAIVDACEAASQSGGPIRVGVGIHAGETLDAEEGIVSAAVNIAARLCSAAGQGEVLVSDTVRGLTRSSLDVVFASRGRRRLKGIAEPIAVYRVTRSAAESSQRLLPKPALAAVIAVVGIAVLAITAALASQGRLVGGRTPSSSPDRTSPSAAETHDLSRFNDPGEFPNAFEQTLLDQLPSQITTSCERADPASVPEFYRPDGGVGGIERHVLLVRAGVSCLTGATRVTYWQASDQPWGWVEDLFFTLVNKRSLEEGSCQDRGRAYEAWSAGAHSGHLMCYARADEAVLEWSYADALIYAVASRRDGDMRELLDWWRDIGRLLSR